MPDAVQSELRVLNITNLRTNSPDHHATLVVPDFGRGIWKLI